MNTTFNTVADNRDFMAIEWGQVMEAVYNDLDYHGGTMNSENFEAFTSATNHLDRQFIPHICK